MLHPACGVPPFFYHVPYFIPEPVGIGWFQPYSFNGCQHFHINDSRPAAILLSFIPVELPCIPYDNREYGRFGLYGESEGSVFKLVQSRRKFFTDKPFRKDHHAPSQQQVFMRAFECLEG